MRILVSITPGIFHVLEKAELPTIAPKMITVLTRYRPNVLELI